MKNHLLSKTINCVKLISFTMLLACSFSLMKSEAARAECGGIYQEDLQKGSVNGEPANVRVASWAQGGCQDFYTKKGVLEFRTMMEWNDNCKGTSYAECGVLRSYVNEKRVKILGEFDGANSYGWKFEDSEGRIYRAIIYK